MKKSLFITAVCLGLSGMVAAQKTYEKVYFKEASSEANGIQLAVVDVVSTASEAKFKLKVTNTTNDFVLYKPEESKFLLNGEELKPTEKWMFIAPNSQENKVINVASANCNKILNYTFVAEGFYFIKMQDGKITAPEFKLPASTNDFKAGPYEVVLDKATKESDKTTAKFKAIYKGENIGFLFPSKVAVKMPDGTEYASAFKDEKAVILRKGDSKGFKAGWDRMPGGRTNDMQLVEMLITWNNVFQEGIPEKTAGQTLNIEWNEALTDAKK